ncbi:ariadne RING finger [Stemphylium lycopersici]|uniref:Ariadne RING finger n=1 Tax=Stemphylium lycopersici TaxID=183478 RepID=A0A364MYB5_STELY|nr:ariadne RING finger [Stemphylium lycopersici]
MSTLSQPASHPSCLDDELTALMLQLEELGVYSNTGKGKHPVGRPPNIEIVYDQFQAELRDYKTFLDDQKLAQSIGAAVHTDGAIIEDVLSQNVQAHEDHRFALELSNNDPEIETPPPFCDALHADIQDWSSVPHGIAAASITEFSDDEIKAGPSMTYADRQADVLNKLSMQFQCYACTDRFPRASMVTTKCSHRCCRQSIPLTLVANHMTEDELETFQLSAVEYATNDKTYCSNPECATFLPPATIDADTKRVAYASAEPSSAMFVVCAGKSVYALQQILIALKNVLKRLWAET